MEKTLDLGHLALFVGYSYADAVEAELRKKFPGLRFSHGFVFQHLLDGPKSIGALAKLQGVSQQAISKTISELDELGYVERITKRGDGRIHHVGLSKRGIAAIARARGVRLELEHRLTRTHGTRAMGDARRLLAAVLATLGGVDAVRQRRVRAPR